MLLTTVTSAVVFQRESDGAVAAGPRPPTAVDKLVTAERRAAGQHLITPAALSSTPNCFRRRVVVNGAATHRDHPIHGDRPIASRHTMKAGSGHGVRHQRRYRRRSVVLRQLRRCRRTVGYLNGTRRLRSRTGSQYLAQSTVSNLSFSSV